MTDPIRWFCCPKCKREFTTYHGLRIHQNHRRKTGKCKVTKP